MGNLSFYLSIRVIDKFALNFITGEKKKPVGASYQQTILYLCEIDVVAIVIFVLIANLPRKVTAVVEFAVDVVQTGN